MYIHAMEYHSIILKGNVGVFNDIENTYGIMLSQKSWYKSMGFFSKKKKKVPTEKTIRQYGLTEIIPQIVEL